RRQENAAALDKEIGERALGQLAALVEKDGLARACSLRGGKRAVVTRTPRRLVVQQRIGRIHPLRCKDKGKRRHVAERGGGCFDLAACVQNETHALRRYEAAHRFFKRAIDLARIAGDLEKRRGGFEALQMALAQYESAFVPAEGFDQ